MWVQPLPPVVSWPGRGGGGDKHTEGTKLDWHTGGFAGGLLTGFFGGSSSCTAAGLGAGAFFFGAGAAAGGGAALGGAEAPDLHLTVARSKASFTFALRMSGRPSITGLRGRSPTIFINVPRHVAASVLAPSNPSSRSTARVSARGLIWAG